MWCLLAGCANSWTSKPLAYSFEDIWDTTYRVLAKRYDIIRASIEDRRMETDWKPSMSIFYLKSYRRKVIAQIEDYVSPLQEEEENKKGEKAKYLLKIQVLQEQNRNIDHPGSLKEASWRSVENDREMEKTLINFITTQLSLKKSPEPTRKKEETGEFPTKGFREIPRRDLFEE